MPIVSLQASTYTSTLLGILSVLIWGAAVGIAGSITRSIGPLTAAGSVYSIAALLSLAFIFLRGDFQNQYKQLRASSVIPCFLFFAMNLTFFWISIGSASNATIIPELGVVNYLWPTLTIVLGIFIVGRKTQPLFYLGVLLAACGVLSTLLEVRGIGLLSISQHVLSEPLPFLYSFLGALSWAVYSNLTKRLQHGLSAIAVSFYLLLVGVVLCLLGFILQEKNHFTSKATIEIVLLGISDAAAYLFWDIGMRKGNAVLIVSLSYLTPILSAVFTILYLDLSTGASLWIGSLLVVAGAYFCNKFSSDPSTI